MNGHSVNRKRFERKKVLSGCALGILAVVVLLYLGLPAAMAVVTVLPNREPVGATPGGFRNVALETEDGISLQAWYHPPANGAAVILLHGAGNSRAATASHASMLARQGFGVLSLDLRGHGESGGRTNRFGWQAARDVAAAVAFLQDQEEVRVIGGMGLSLGGETLLGAASQFPAIRAIVADGATHRFTAELLALESERPLVRSFTARMMYATVGLLTGEEPPSPLLDSILAAGSTQFFLVAGGAEGQEVVYNRLFADRLGARAALWVAPGVGHMGAYGRYPAEYEQKVTEFFERNLIDSGAN